MKNYLVIGILVFVLGACASAPSDDSSEEVTTGAVTTEIPVVEATTVAEVTEIEDEVETTAVDLVQVLDESLVNQVDTLVADQELEALWALLESELASSNEMTAEYALLQYITLAQEKQFEVSDPLFSEMGIEAQNMIYTIIETDAEAFDHVHVIISQDKSTLLARMSGEEQALIQNVFDQGFGLLNAEGAYYAVVDYGELLDQYGQYLSEGTERMLAIFKDIIIDQTTVEEYLAITPDKLMERSIDLEEHLINYPEAPDLYKTMVRRHFNICLSKLSFPSPFDGGIGDDGTLAPSFERIYQEIIEGQGTPVVRQVATEVMAWVETREDGYLGTYNDMEDLYTITGGIYGRATERVTALY